MARRRTKGKVLKWQTSLAIRIPRAIATGAGLKAGDTVELTIKEGAVSIRDSSRVPRLADLVARITPENRHPEIRIGRLSGNESPIW